MQIEILRQRIVGETIRNSKSPIYNWKAFDPAFLDAVLAEERGWRDLPVPPMSLVVFRREDLAAYSMEPFAFVAQERKGAR